MAGFRKAKAEQAALKMGLYGPAGSGKTLTSLLCAEGLARLTGKRVAYVDTERGTDFYCKAVAERKVHPEAFDFDAMYTRSIQEVLSACKSLKAAEHGVIVIDSITHIWEACRNAYSGRQTKAGTIPMHAWGKIKAPYKELMNLLLSSPMHVLFCGRQGNEYAENDEGELTCVGVKMKAEGETAYEPHILIRMEAIKQKDGTAVVQAFAEKDRSGILYGKTIKWPNFDNLCKPLLHLLGGTQAVVESDDDVALRDAEAAAAMDAKKARESASMLEEFDVKIRRAHSKDELAAVGKELTAEIKKQMLPHHVTQLRESYRKKEAAFSGQVVSVPAGEE